MKTVVAIVLASSLVILGCAKKPPILPTYCAVVSTTNADNSKILDVFERFAKSENLKRSSADPGARWYQDNTEKVQLLVTVGVGPLGSLVTLYDSRSGSPQDEKGRIANFVTQNVAPIWGVRDCSAVKDLKPPVIYE